MKYFAKEGISLNGKARVFFCFYRYADREFFEEIKNLVTENGECILWYNDDDMDTDEVFSLLEDMQLLVVPVSDSILKMESLLSRILDFAESSGIPVMPVLQSPVKTDKYEKIFGSTQYISKYEDYSFGLKYEDRIRSMLESVSAEGDIQERIKSNFDGQIFLSYRKKDREYARKLMKMIHSEKEFENIAIWYDDFLIPGENYNDSITEELVKSDIFSLVITPNLINEKNYVMTIEYPLASEHGKILFPVEYIQSDRKLLEKYYPGINGITDSEKEQEFKKNLKNRLSHAHITYKQRNPESDYLLGMAFYYGINTEVDRERGLELIESSADSGFPEAMKRMAVIKCSSKYMNSIQEGVYYQAKYIDYLESVFSPDKEHIEQLLKERAFYMNIMSDELDVLERVKIKRTARTIIELCDEYSGVCDTDAYKYQAQVVLSSHYADDIMNKDFDISKTLEYDKSNIELTYHIYMKNGSLDSLHNHIDVYYFYMLHMTKEYEKQSAVAKGLCTSEEVYNQAEVCTKLLDDYLKLSEKASESVYRRALKLANRFTYISFFENEFDRFGKMYTEYFYNYYKNKKNKNTDDYFEYAHYIFCKGWEEYCDEEFENKAPDEKYNTELPYYMEAVSVIENMPENPVGMTRLDMTGRLLDFKEKMFRFYLTYDCMAEAESVIDEIYHIIENVIVNYETVLDETELENLEMSVQDISFMIEKLHVDSYEDLLSAYTRLTERGYSEEAEKCREKAVSLYRTALKKCGPDFAQALLKQRIDQIAEIFIEDDVSAEEAADFIISRINDFENELGTLSEDETTVFHQAVLMGITTLISSPVDAGNAEELENLFDFVSELCLKEKLKNDMFTDYYVAVPFWKQKAFLSGGIFNEEEWISLYEESCKYTERDMIVSELYYYDIKYIGAFAAFVLYENTGSLEYLEDSLDRFVDIHLNSELTYNTYIYYLTWAEYYMWDETGDADYFDNAVNMFSILEEEADGEGVEKLRELLFEEE